MEEPTAPTPSTMLEISAWTDPAVDVRGIGPNSREFAILWTPLLGPAATALFRVLAEIASDTPDPVSVATLAAAIGVGERKARLAVIKALERLEYHHFLHFDLPRVAVRRLAPPLSQRHLRRLPEAWITAADALLEQNPPPRLPDSPAQSPRPRAPESSVSAAPPGSAKVRRAALGLLRRGADPASVRRELAAWGTSGDEVDRVVAWASAAPDTRSVSSGPGDQADA